MSGADDPCASVELTADDGASVRFCAHGGHVLGWTPAGGAERLWLSRDTGCGPGTAIRGGVPVIWPQFSERGTGPRHGVARDRAWQVLGPGVVAPDDLVARRPGAAVARLRLVCNGEATTFGHPFTLHLVVAAAGAELWIRVTARNDGTEPFEFTAALHTYLRVSSTAQASVHGLQGRTARANDGGTDVRLPDAPLTVEGPLDVAVPGVTDGPAGALVLHDEVLGDLVLTATGFDSRVVWNPGRGRAPADVHPGGEAEFVCLEPTLLDPATLHPGQTWTGEQLLRA